MKLTITNRIFLTCIVIFYIGVLLIWEHFNGGVKTHYLLHREDLPSFSNYWSLVVGALLTWITLYRVHRRTKQKPEAEENLIFRKALIRFLVSFLVGLSFGIFFLLGYELIINLIMIGLLVTSFIIPLYKTEYLLGYVIGLTYAIGAALPTIFGLILIGIFSITYITPRWVFSKLKSN